VCRSAGIRPARHAPAGNRAISADLGRDRAGAQRPDEQAPCRGQVAPGRQQHIGDLAMPVNRPVEFRFNVWRAGITYRRAKFRVQVMLAVSQMGIPCG
jgi:hypothetical protein